MVGGVTALERSVRSAAKRGATRAIVAAPRVVFPRALPIEVEFVAEGSAPPDGATRERADVVAGIELVDDDARKQAEWKLIRGSNKAWEGPVDALINWRFSMRITRWIAARSLAWTPNHVTICAILFGLTGSLVASGHGGVHGWVQFALGGLLLQINSIFDSVDGELARLRFQFSKLGQWLDNLSDDVVDNLFVAAVGIGLGGMWATIGIATAVVRVGIAATQYLSVYARTGTGDVFAFRWWFESTESTHTEIYDLKKPMTWLRSFGRRDTFVFVWMLACFAHLPYWVVVHAAVICVTYLVLLLLHFTMFRARR